MKESELEHWLESLDADDLKPTSREGQASPILAPPPPEKRTQFQRAVLQDLTPEQIAAVTIPATESATVDAGAGTGKTKTLIARIAWIASLRVPLGSILALTFTRKAAAEMRARLYEVFVGEAKDAAKSSTVPRLPRACTYHALGTSVIRWNCELASAMLTAEHGEEVRITKHATILDESDTRSKMQEVIAHMLGPGDRRNATKKDIQGLLDEMGTHVTDHTTYDRLVERYESAGRMMPVSANGQNVGTIPAWDLVRMYQKRKAVSNTLDYADLIQLAVRLMEGYPETRPEFRYILVDEYQDTDPLQERMLTALTHNGEVGVYAVGDPSQTLYSWRGARSSILTEMPKRRNCRRHPLTLNFRSTPSILRVANATLVDPAGGPTAQPTKELTAAPGHPPDGAVELRSFGNPYAEAAWAAEDCMAAKARGVPPKEMAILCRTAYALTPFDAALTKLGMPFRVTAGRKFAQRAEVMDVLAWLKVIDNDADDTAVRRCLLSPPRGLRDASMRRLTDHQRAAGGTLLEAVRTAVLTRFLTAKPLTAAEDTLKWLDELHRGQSMGAHAGETVAAIRRLTGIDRRLETERDKGGKDRASAMQRLERLDDLTRIATEQRTVRRLIDHLTIADSDADAKAGGMLTLGTIHSAKGLEWTKVHVGALEDGIMPAHRRDGDPPGRIEEERRVLHVAVTRAKEDLTLSWSRTRREKPTRRSPMLDPVMALVTQTKH